MVRLTRIYTRGGDKGKTSLGDGRRVSKHDLRIEALGAVDEANAALGVARLHISAPTPAQMIARIQNDLFDLGADLCLPEAPGTEGRLRMLPSQVGRLETEIDTMNQTLSPLSSFILPGGTPASAYLHLARTVVRRAERLVSRLAERQGVNPAALAYVNRLSDHLFVLARILNEGANSAELWAPGATR